MSTFANVKKQYIEGIYQTKALLIKEHPLTLQSGKKSHLYLNHRHFLTNAHYLAVIAQLYYELIQNKTNHYSLGVVDSIMSPLIVGAMSALYKIDYIVIQKKAMTHRTEESIFGSINKPIVLVDDMTSTGETLLDAARSVRAQGGIVDYAVISAYREPSALRHLKSHRIEPLAIVSFTEIIHELTDSLTEQEKRIVQKYPLLID